MRYVRADAHMCKSQSENKRKGRERGGNPQPPWKSWQRNVKEGLGVVF